ncbi:MAG TPA: VOC family protein [Gaiellaceae bacterium]
MPQTVVPMVAYEDAAAAIEWLGRAFGFRENVGERYTEEDGRVTHAELDAGDGAVIYVANPTPDYVAPTRHREECDAAARWSSVPWVVDGLLVHVADVKEHFAAAEAAGAKILSPVEEGPDGLRYRAEDVEGHRWMFVGR